MRVFKSDDGKKLVLNRYREILNDWPVSNKQYKVKTNYGETFVIESGTKDKPPLILLHGSTSNSYCWTGDVQSYSDKYNVYAIDIIGEAGFSDETRPSYESGAYSAWLMEVIHALGLKQVSMVGLSLGGWMALNYAVKYPWQVSKLILLCPGGLYPEKKSFLVKAIGYSLLGAWGKNQIMKMINGGKSPDLSEPGLKEALAFTRLISSNFNPRMDKLTIYSKSELQKLTMPILVIYGARDCLINAHKSVEHIKKSAVNVQTKIIENMGHVVTGQTQRIIKFIEESR